MIPNEAITAAKRDELADIRINYGGGSLVSDSITLTAEECDAAWGKLLAAMEEKFRRNGIRTGKK